MESVVSVRITSSVSSFGSERRFPVTTKLRDLKGKLELITGASSQSMELSLYGQNDQLICPLTDDDSTLQSCSIANGMRIHVIDKYHKAGEYDDVTQVQKYEMKDEDYGKRVDSVRAFKERQKLGRFNPEVQKKKEEELEQEKVLAGSIPVGARCEVCLAKGLPRRGTVAFVGETDFKPGHWVGVCYDEPMGKHNGSVGGKRYFECEMKYGGFVKPKFVTVGDFPIEKIDSDEDEI
eukprot:m.9849 g.9849  ORF g.9849 m.9849 type:complete len:236 (+) comp21696_c0_seq1:36-743(+)